LKKLSIFLLSFILISCAGLPEKVKPVTDFNLQDYKGTWYEIARLDHRFERGLERVTATYSINEDGTVKVTNKGYSTKSNEWKEAIGKAKFEGGVNTGYLEVSFFGPFYGSYVIFDLDKESYQYSFVTGSENSLWLLSRTPAISDELKKKFVNTVSDLGYDIDELIYVKQD
jgi:apolipoprotein D and lipocalin family protein